MASQLANPKLFLDLLIAELQNQNPTSPTSPSTIMNQTSSLAQMEAMTQLSTNASAQQQAAQAGEATGLIGKTVAAMVAGKPVSGTVSAVTIDSTGTPSLVVGKTSVPLSAITKIN
jgi:flagellar basal-body rod modification protein FlgD